MQFKRMLQFDHSKPDSIVQEVTMTPSIQLFSLVFLSMLLNTLANSPPNISKISENISKVDSVTSTYRLPNNTKPEAYSLFIHTDIADGKFDYFGTVKINITILRKSNQITLHQHELDIQTVELTSKNHKTISIQSPQYDRTRDFIVLKTINYTFVSGEMVFLKIKFKGNLRQDLSGFYRSSYEKSNMNITDNLVDSHNNSNKLYTKKYDFFEKSILFTKLL